METKVLKAIYDIANKESFPVGHPVFPESLMKELSLTEDELVIYLRELRDMGLIKFPALGTNIVTLTKIGLAAGSNI